MAGSVLRGMWSEVDANEKTAGGFKEVVEGCVWRYATEVVTIPLVIGNRASLRSCL